MKPQKRTPKSSPKIRSKKAGSSKSKSKIRPNSKTSKLSTTAGFAELARAAAPSGAARGYASSTDLFQTFQQNLLSLLSHELRTPMMGVLNPLRLLDDGVPGQAISNADLLQMARRNAERLHRTLETLLDLAAIEGGAFHARLREVDLSRLIEVRVAALSALASENGLAFRALPAESSRAVEPVLGDLAKLSRAVDLCFEVIASLARAGSTVSLATTGKGLEFRFELKDGADAEWQKIWAEAQIGFQSRVSAPGSAFGGMVQSEAQFLSRARDGLGSELWLIHELLRLHQGRMTEKGGSNHRILSLEIPAVRSEEGLKQVLASRLDAVVQQLASFSLVCVRVPRGSGGAEEFAAALRGFLYRSGDGAFPYRGHVILILEDCAARDQAKLMARLARKLPAREALVWGGAAAPSEAIDGDELLRIARSRLK